MAQRGVPVVGRGDEHGVEFLHLEQACGGRRRRGRLGFFQLLKRERIKKRIYKNREKAKADIFDYVEMFYNAKRRHSACEDQPPAAYESAWFMRHGTV